MGIEDLDQRVTRAADLVTVALDHLLPRTDGPESRLNEAMRYAVLGPGQRWPSFFALEAARMFPAVDERSVLRAACALECVYAQGHVRQDLPALDDADRRGNRPSLHKAYDQATAILAADALQAMATEILADPDTHPESSVRAELLRRLALASGVRGLIGGQMLHMLGSGADLRTVARMQRLRTGVLITFAFEIPLILARAPEAERHALAGFAQDLGLAQQIVNDLNRPAGGARREKARPRSTSPPARPDFVTLLGADAAAGRVDLLAGQSKAHLDIFGERAAYLRASVDFVLDRGP